MAKTPLVRKIIFTIIINSVFISNAQKPIVDKRFNGLDAAFQQVLKDWKAAGFAVAVVEKNKVVYAKGFGYRDVEKKLPVTPNTLFAIGSCTKAFTASLIGLLQAEGKLDIDKPAHTYLNSLQFQTDEMNNAITLRDMMSHRTGLPRHDYSWYFFNTPSRDSFIQRLQFQQPTARVRDKWQYNNFMFLAQGSIAEKLTGKTWEENIREKFFIPLSMSSSNFSISDLQKNTDGSLGYSVKKDSLIKKLPYYNIDAMGPAGSINSNVNDMAKWVIAWINGGKWNGKEIIPAIYFTQAISSQAIVGAGLPSKERPDVQFSTYGFGWFLASYRGHYRVEHGGNIDGFSASTSFFPTDSIGIIVLTNQNSSRVPGLVRNMIADRMLNLKPYDWNGDAKKEVEKAKALAATNKKTTVAPSILQTKPSHPLKDYAGSYYQPGYGRVHVFAKKDSLFAQIAGHLMWLKHDNFDVFDFFEIIAGEEIDTADSGPTRMQFLLNKKGDVDRVAIDLEGGIEPLIFKKELVAKEVAASSLQKYVGEYDLAGTAIKVFIKNNKTLYVFVPGQPEYELLPTDNDRFAFKALSGYYLLFGASTNGKIPDVTFIQPNGNFKAIRK
jgi:CubicO group peptidase (beta-lactamase class C family)